MTVDAWNRMPSRPKRRTIDLEQPQKNVSLYVADLPDGRKLEVARVSMNVAKALRSGALSVRAVPVWALAVIDRENEMVSDATGFPTRADAVDFALRWVDENPRGTVVATEA